MSSWGPVFLVSRRAPSSRLTWVAKSSRLRGESWAGLSPRRREAREENAKDFSLVAALLLCENGLSWHGRPRPCRVGSNLRARQEIRCTFCCWPAGGNPDGRGGGRGSAA